MDKSALDRRDVKILEIPHLILISDPGKDPDDEGTFLHLAGLQRMGLVKLEGVVTCLHPSLERAQLAKGTFNTLGLKDVLVGVGSSCDHTADPKDFEFNPAKSYLANENEIINYGLSLLLEKLKAAPDNSLSFLLIAGLTDVKKLLETAEGQKIFKQKVREVVLMSGIKLGKNGEPILENGFMIPDDSANNKFDKEAANFTFRILQELAISMVIVDRTAAYASKVPAKIYDRLDKTEHPVGKKLLEAQKQAIEHLWQEALVPVGAPGRYLPDRCDKKWFCDTFLGGKGENFSASDSIWDLVQNFSWYDQTALIAAVPDLRQKYYNPKIVRVGNADHVLVGAVQVKDPERLANFMMGLAVQSLQSAK